MISEMSKNLSAFKKTQISLRNNLRNKSHKSAIKTIKKKALAVLKDVTASESQLVDNYLSEAYSKIDKAVTKGIMKKNKAARQKSRLLKKLRQ